MAISSMVAPVYMPVPENPFQSRMCLAACADALACISWDTLSINEPRFQLLAKDKKHHHVFRIYKTVDI